MRYVDVQSLAITRRPFRGRWVYVDADGERITDSDEIARLERIGLPPAYAEAAYAPDPECHILATGIDARGRKQYIYHPDFVAQRDARKFGACVEFGLLLPRMRARVEKDLAGRGLNRERAIASIVRLLDSGRIRVGNEAYARANRSFGATTLRQRHARIVGNRLALRFRAKSGKLCTLAVSDRALVRFARQVQDLPGQHLFQYRDEDGQFHPVCSNDVNAYVRDVMGETHSAKDFRTWTASALAFEYLVTTGEDARLREMLDHVALHLGNTPAVARKSYIHPALVEAVRTRELEPFRDRLPRQTRWLTRHERGLLAYLQRQASPCGARN